MCWGEGVWEDPEGAGDTEPLNSDEPPLPVEEVSPLLTGRESSHLHLEGLTVRCLGRR